MTTIILLDGNLCKFSLRATSKINVRLGVPIRTMCLVENHFFQSTAFEFLNSLCALVTLYLLKNVFHCVRWSILPFTLLCFCRHATYTHVRTCASIRISITRPTHANIDMLTHTYDTSTLAHTYSIMIVPNTHVDCLIINFENYFDCSFPRTRTIVKAHHLNDYSFLLNASSNKEFSITSILTAEYVPNGLRITPPTEKYCNSSKVYFCTNLTSPVQNFQES